MQVPPAWSSTFLLSNFPVLTRGIAQLHAAYRGLGGVNHRSIGDHCSPFRFSFQIASVKQTVSLAARWFDQKCSPSNVSERDAKPIAATSSTRAPSHGISRAMRHSSDLPGTSLFSR